MVAGYLTEYEQNEVKDYEQVYFTGKGAQKVRSHRSGQPNSGYDDERGDYVRPPPTTPRGRANQPISFPPSLSPR